jgi:lauroyl/myristoyl acyltransferase
VIAPTTTDLLHLATWVGAVALVFLLLMLCVGIFALLVAVTAAAWDVAQRHRRAKAVRRELALIAADEQQHPAKRFAAEQLLKARERKL